MGAFLSAIPGLIGGAGKIIGGLGSSKAAGAAANIESGAYQDAFNAFLESMGRGNQYLQDASGKAIGWAGDAANWAQGTALDTAKSTSQNVADLATSAGQRVTGDTATANALLDPYVKGGAAAFGKLSDLADQNFVFNQDDPSYQWRLQEGQKALERSAAARGGSMGGAAAKAIARYGQGAASTEYQAAFDRFRANRSDRTGILSGLAGMGATAADRSGQNTIGAGKYAGDIGYRAGEYGGNVLNQAGQYAGNVGVNAAQYAGDKAVGTSRDLTQNINTETALMNQMRLGKADATAGGILGQQAGKNQAWSGGAEIGMSLADLLQPRAATPTGMRYAGGGSWAPAAPTGYQAQTPWTVGAGGPAGVPVYTAPYQNTLQPWNG